MGWTGHKLEKGYLLFTRGGLQGVFVGHDEDDKLEINIPEELLLRLAADEVRAFKISQLEDMDDKKLLGISQQEE